MKTILNFLILIGFFLSLIPHQAHAEDISISRYNEENPIPLCKKIYRKIYRNPHPMITEDAICNKGAGAELTKKLESLEEENRLVFDSNQKTQDLLNQASFVISSHKNFVETWSQARKDCKVRPRPQCLLNRYLMLKEARGLMEDYKRTRDKLLVATQCPSFFLCNSTGSDRTAIQNTDKLLKSTQLHLQKTLEKLGG